MERKAALRRAVMGVLVAPGVLALAPLPCAAQDGGEVPHVFWVSQPVGPDETVLAATGGSTASSRAELARLADDDPAQPGAAAPEPKFETAPPLQASATSIKFAVPASWHLGVFALRVVSQGRHSAITLINAPDIWFAQGDQGESAVPGGWIQVHGSCLALPGGQPRLALVRDGRIVAKLAAQTAANGYALRFAVPIDTEPGRYQIYLHNGFGGPSAWSRFHTFVDRSVDDILIAPAPKWPAESIDVSRQTGANDDARFAAALAALAGRGGGILSVPAGTFTLTRQLQIPEHALIRGAGREKTLLRWTATPTDPASGGAKPLALIVGAPLSKGSPDHAALRIEDLSIEAAPDFVFHAVESTATRERGVLARVRIHIPNRGEFDSKNDLHAIAVFLRHCKGYAIVDSELDAAIDVFARDDVSYLRFENNRFNWTEANIWLSGRSHNFIVANNIFNLRGTADRNGWTAVASRQHGTNPNPGFWFTAFYGTSLPGTSMSGPYTRDLYYAGNRSTRDEKEVPPFYAGLTYDGGEGIYLGKVRAADGTRLQLSGTTLQPANAGQYEWAGAIAQVVDGRGAGQWRYLVHAGAGANEVEVDRPWDLAPDASSTVNLVNLQGRVLMVDNDFAQEQTNQQYYFALDVIKAHNSYGVDGAKAGDLTWMGKHYHSLSPGWHLQVLDNRVVRGDGSIFRVGVMERFDGYSGTSGAYQVFRNNHAEGSIPFAISLTSKAGRYADAVVEHNTPDTFDLGPNRSDPLNVTGILLRGNGGRLAGNIDASALADPSVLKQIK